MTVCRDVIFRAFLIFQRATSVEDRVMSDTAYTEIMGQPALQNYQGTIRPQASLPHYATMQSALAHLKPNDSVNVIFPEVLREYARDFLDGFPGDVLYAVKANPHPFVLETLWQAGVHSYDVASLREVELVTAFLPHAKLYMMHPVKSRQTIRRSYELGVRDFAFDHMSELVKIAEETDSAHDLSLHLRLTLPSMDAVYSLEGKFGAAFEEAAILLKEAQCMAESVGVTFHVGSQCMNPVAYREALRLLRGVLDREALTINSVDVGGGFPVNYPGMEAPDLGQYFEMIYTSLNDYGYSHLQILGEPGRALVAEGGSTLVRVEMRRGNELYLNDGTYGALFDAGTPKWRFPVALIPGDGRETSASLETYSFWGPTCDAVDRMEGPFLLPEDIREGDWIEVGNLGAYGQTMATRFNGFYAEHTITVDEEPIVWRGPIGSVLTQ